MGRVLMKGTEAIAEAAIQAGCKYFFGYPITPQNEIPEYMSAHLPEVGGVTYRPRVKSHQSTWCWAEAPPGTGL